MTARRQGVSCLLAPFLGPPYSYRRTSLTYDAAVSAVIDAILIRTILCWALQGRILMDLYLDPSAARGVLSRRGVGRLRHLSCRVLDLAPEFSG